MILIAKDDQTHRDCSNQFESRKVFKEYVAIAVGALDRDSDYIEGALKMHPHDRLRMIVSSDPDAKPALSYYEVLERFRGFTLVKVQPRTGRTHQIRVHLLHAGCPVLADKLYGGRAHLKLSDLAPDTSPGEDSVLIDRQGAVTRTASCRPSSQAPANGAVDRSGSPAPHRTCAACWKPCASIGPADKTLATKKHKGHKRRPKRKLGLNALLPSSSAFFCALCAFLWLFRLLLLDLCRLLPFPAVVLLRAIPAD